MSSRNDRQICVVLDTNSWISNMLLRTPLGRSLVFAIIQLEAVIGLPDVVKRELPARWRDLAHTNLTKARDSQQTISGMTGGKFESTLPEEDGLFALCEQRLQELNKLLAPVPMTIEHAQHALDRVIAHLPPNGEKDEQFRDTLLWEAVGNYHLDKAGRIG